VNYAYLTAVQDKEWIYQNGGTFLVSENEEIVCSDARITEIIDTNKTGGYNAVIVMGNFCGVCTYSMEFAATDVGKLFQHLTLSVSIPDCSDHFNGVVLQWSSHSNESFYGFGHQYTHINMKGHRLPVFLTEKGVGRGLEPLTAFMDIFGPFAGGTWYTTYTQVPFYITSEMRSFVLDSPEYAIFDMTQPDFISLHLTSPVLQARIIYGQSYLDILSSYSAYVGRMKPLPEWISSGAILGLQGGTDAVMRTLDDVKSVMGNLSDVAAVWLQDWTGQKNFSGNGQLPRVGLWWNWEVDSTHYPNWTNLVSSLHSSNIRTLTYVNPLLSNVSERGTPYHRNMYAEALMNDYAVKESGKVWTGYGDSILVDLTNPTAIAWFKDIIKQEILSSGVDGWMCDFGESLPLIADLASGEDGHAVHSLYPYLWGKLNSQAIEAAAKNASDVVFFMRSGNYMTPNVSRLFWTGDQLVTWDVHDGIRSAVVAMLTSSLSGFTLTHTDIGGYTAIKIGELKYIRSKELFLRWCELAAFTLMYRSHLGTLPTDNWQFNSDTETMHHFFRFAKVYRAWAFYRQQLMVEAYEKGYPIIRHMIVNYPNFTAVHNANLTYQQFMLGSELLVAPVTAEKDLHVELFLPQDTEWIHVWTNTTITGKDMFVRVAAPVGEPCVLYRSSSLVGKQFLENLRKEGVLM
jgi:alpha-glucosidase (family GH31 glycosyl hydrolase)